MTERLHFHFSLSCIGEGNGNPLQCSCLENPRDSGAWWAAVYGVTQSWTWLKWLSSSSSIYSISVHLYFRSSSIQSECNLHFPECTWRACFSTMGKRVEVKWLRTKDLMNFTLQSISQIVQVGSAWSSVGGSDKLNHRKLKGVWASLVAQKVTNPLEEIQCRRPGSGRSPGEGNGKPLQYSCLESPPDRGAWQATVHNIAKNWTWLSD